MTDRFAVAPDGSAIVLVGDRGELSLVRRGELAPTPVAGAPEGAFAPVFSPDSQWIAFSGGDRLMKIPAAGGTPVTLARSDDYYMNLTWGADDRIRYPSRNNAALRSVSASGGPVESVEFDANTWVNRAYGLPQGQLLVSMIAKGKRLIAIREPDGQVRPLVDGWDGRLTPTSHLLFAQADGATWSLAAVPFDAGSASITGKIGAVWMPDGKRLLFTQFLMDRESQTTSMWMVTTDGAGTIEPIGQQSGAYATGTSADGRVLYYRFEGEAVQTDIMQLALDTPGAQPTSVLATPASEQVALPSPDGRWLAYSTEASGKEEVRVLDLADRSVSTQVSAQGGRPIRWNAASTQLYYLDGDALSVVNVGRGGPIPASRSVAFRLPPDIHGPPDVTPTGDRALVIRGGPIYQDLIVVQGALRNR